MFTRINVGYNKMPLVPQVALVAANLIPLFGVWFLGWEVGTILLIFWAETAVIGFYTILKVIKAEGKEPLPKDAGYNAMLQAAEDNDRDQVVEITRQQLGSFLPRWLLKLVFIIFFQFHFGIFMLVHFVFLNVIFFSESALLFSSPSVSFGVLLSVIGLLISHGISYRKNFIAGGEYKEVALKQLMTQPYKRVAVMHFVVMTSGFLIAFYGGFQVIGATLLIVAKILIDLNSHAKEHLLVDKG